MFVVVYITHYCNHFFFLFLSTVKCDDIPRLRNGSIEEFNFGNSPQAIFKCDIGFTLVGDQTLTCATDGSWNTSFPFCGNFDEIFKGNKSITIYHN